MKDLDKIKKSVSGIVLSRAEKELMRQNILLAVRNSPRERHQYQGSNIFSLLNLKLHPIFSGVAIALILSISLGGAASFAAEGALPGDLLYPVKTGVNEKVSEVLAFSAKNKAEVEANISERRLEEATRLASENRLTESVRSNIEADFARHAQKVEERVQELDNNGDAEEAVKISAKFQRSLSEHKNELEKIEKRNNIKKDAVDKEND